MKFKVGDRVEHEFYGKGTVIGVSNIGTPLVEFDVYYRGLHDGSLGEINGTRETRGKDGHCWFTDSIKPIENQAIVIDPKGLETIALLKEGGKIIKQTSAKCNPTDVYDFEIGAKLAFSRLMGEEVAIIEYQPSIREVKRPAKAGEWIKIVDADAWSDGYKNGDVFKVDELYASREEGIISSPHHIVPREYVVLENYQPEETTKTLADFTDKELINELSRRLEDKQ